MRALLALALGTALALPVAPAVQAANLDVTVEKKTVRVIKHKRLVRVVRDYDGTAVLVRRTRPVVVHDDVGGRRIVLGALEHIALERPTPGRYFNGQPVMPNTRLLRY